MQLNTSELLPNDVVVTHGMACLIDGEIKSSPNYNAEGLTVYSTSARVINLAECKSNGVVSYWENGKFYDGLIPLSWLYPDVFRGGWTKDWDADPRWVIQGNELARWSVIRDQLIIELVKSRDSVSELIMRSSF